MSRTDESVQSQLEQEHRHKQLCDSLQFREINDRRSTIPESHKATFEWIFDSETEKPWDNFDGWLRTGENLYWISGKPGSGKSVLMKYITESKQTHERLEEWAAGMPVLHISFFIWKGGVELQREKRGLLCSLVLQLIRQSQVFSSKVNSNLEYSSKRSPSDWSVKELSDLLSEFTAMQAAKVCLFIDGLDESDATDTDVGMLELVQWMTTLEGWKVCVSSRNEPAFTTALEGYPKLRLQDLTKKDLEWFATDKLQEIGQHMISDDLSERAAPTALVKLVCDKADGVFLWVRLAVSTIIREVGQTDGWNDLTKSLTKLPSELEQLYVDMWHRGEEEQTKNLAEVAQYFRMVISAQRNPLSCFELMVHNSQAARALLEDPQTCTDLAQLLEECHRVEQKIVNSSRGFLESCDVVRITPNSRSDAEKLTLIEEETPSQIRVFRHRRILFVHRTAIDFLQDTPTGQRILSTDPSQTYDLSEVRINAMLVAPYCEFPIVDLFDLRQLFFAICNAEISDREKFAIVTKFELVHEKINRSHNLPKHTDMIRNWIDAVDEGRWKTPRNTGALEDFSVSPFRYAIGWKSYAAHAGLTPYFKQVLVNVSDGKLYSDYASCLAICAADNYHIHADGSTHEIQQLQIIKLLHDLGANLNTRYPLTFGSSPLVDPLSLFCIFHTRAFLPNEDERDQLLSSLQQLLKLGIKSRATACALHVDFSRSEYGNTEVWTSLHAAKRSSFTIRGGRSIAIVEFNLSALLRFYAQSIGASEEQISALLEGQGEPECKLLALKMGTFGSTKVRRPATLTGESREFYDRLDKCASFGRMTQQINLRDSTLGIEEKEANDSLHEIMDGIFGRASEIEFEDLMTSSGLWTTTRVRPSDVPFLQPFGHESVDCSKFMFTE